MAISSPEARWDCECKRSVTLEPANKASFLSKKHWFNCTKRQWTRKLWANRSQNAGGNARSQEPSGQETIPLSATWHCNLVRDILRALSMGLFKLHWKSCRWDFQHVSALKRFWQATKPRSARCPHRKNFVSATLAGGSLYAPDTAILKIIWSQVTSGGRPENRAPQLILLVLLVNV